MSKGSPIGIDLGTTNSCVGVIRKGRVEIIANEQGFRITPSCVAFNEDERLVGNGAKLQASWNPENTLYEVKRLIGRKYKDPKLVNKFKNWPFKVINQDGNPFLEVEYENEIKKFTPEEISAMILSKMKKIAEEFTGEDVHEAVITIPAYFTDSQRQATLDAGEIAGLTVLKILNEPTAAAIAYGIDKNITEKQNILVFDLGGGTFDVVILTVENANFEVLAVSGDTYLGGGDFDSCLVEHFVQEFRRRSGVDVRTNKKALGKLRDVSEKVKCQLSASMQERVQIEQLVPGHDFVTVMRRSRFESLCSALFTRVIDPIKTVMKDSKLEKSDIHEIVLVGGSTRIPKIQQLVQDFFDGRELNKTINPDEAVAHGATLQAASLAGEPGIAKIQMSDVVPMSLGVEIVGNRMDKIILKNTKYPVSVTQSYTAIDKSKYLLISIFEGEDSKASKNSLLGKFKINGIEIGRNATSKIKINFEVDENCILRATATDRKTQATNSITITSTKGRLGKKQIKKMVNEHSKYDANDKRLMANSSAANELEQYCSVVQRDVEKEKSKGRIAKKDADKILKECEEILDWLLISASITRDDCMEKRTSLENICEGIY